MKKKDTSYSNIDESAGSVNDEMVDKLVSEMVARKKEGHLGKYEKMVACRRTALY